MEDRVLKFFIRYLFKSLDGGLVKTYPQISAYKKGGSDRERNLIVGGFLDTKRILEF